MACAQRGDDLQSRVGGRRRRAPSGRSSDPARVKAGLSVAQFEPRLEALGDRDVESKLVLLAGKRAGKQPVGRQGEPDRQVLQAAPVQSAATCGIDPP